MHNTDTGVKSTLPVGRYNPYAGYSLGDVHTQYRGCRPDDSPECYPSNTGVAGLAMALNWAQAINGT